MSAIPEHKQEWRTFLGRLGYVNSQTNCSRKQNRPLFALSRNSVTELAWSVACHLDESAAEG